MVEKPKWYCRDLVSDETRDCVTPWTGAMIHADQSVSLCCWQPPVGSITGDLQLSDVINSDNARKLRMELLTGDLNAKCRECPGRSATSLAKLHAKVRYWLTHDVEENQLNSLVDDSKTNDLYSTSIESLTTTHRSESFSIEPTTNCNLRCVYCASRRNGYKGANFDFARLGRVCEQIVGRRAKIVAFSGHGETTIVRNWNNYCNILLENGLQVVLVSNLSREMTDAEIETLSRLSRLTISIDTVDSELSSQIRCGLDLDILFVNMLRIRLAAKRNGISGPVIQWTCVLSDKVSNGLEDFVRTGIILGVNRFEFKNLEIWEDLQSKAG